MRSVQSSYQDPLEIIWTHAAREFGMKIARSSEVFASWDGKGLLTIGSPETLDADDSLAQMILHEICHALVEGPDAFAKADWGVDITNRDDRVHEHACLRLQAALAEPYGLRQFFAATTVFRVYYDSLPANPLGDTSDPAVRLALPGRDRALYGPWAGPLRTAFEQTVAIAEIVRPSVPPLSLWETADSRKTE